MEANFEELRQSFRSGRTRSLEWRKNQLISLIQFIHDKENAIFEALYQDLGKHPVEIFRDEVNFLVCLLFWDSMFYQMMVIFIWKEGLILLVV